MFHENLEQPYLKAQRPFLRGSCFKTVRYDHLATTLRNREETKGAYPLHTTAVVTARAPAGASPGARTHRRVGRSFVSCALAQGVCSGRARADRTAPSHAPHQAQLTCRPCWCTSSHPGSVLLYRTRAICDFTFLTVNS